MAEIDDIRALSDDELEDELEDTHRALMNLRFRAATMQLADMNEVGRAKRRIARIETVRRERELAAEAV